MLFDPEGNKDRKVNINVFVDASFGNVEDGKNPVRILCETEAYEGKHHLEV